MSLQRFECSLSARATYDTAGAYDIHVTGIANDTTLINSISHTRNEPFICGTKERGVCERGVRWMSRMVFGVYQII